MPSHWVHHIAPTWWFPIWYVKDFLSVLAYPEECISMTIEGEEMEAFALQG